MIDTTLFIALHLLKIYLTIAIIVFIFLLVFCFFDKTFKKHETWSTIQLSFAIAVFWPIVLLIVILADRKNAYFQKRRGDDGNY